LQARRFVAVEGCIGKYVDNNPTKGKVHGFLCEYHSAVHVQRQFQGCSTQDTESWH
jgi:hypothetical protein